MTLYHIEWHIEIDADSPTDAAKRALKMHRDPDSTATVFNVTKHDSSGVPLSIDAAEAHDKRSLFDQWKASASFRYDLRLHEESHIREFFENERNPVPGYSFSDGSFIQWCPDPGGYLVIIGNMQMFYSVTDERDDRPWDDACEYLFTHHAIDNL